MDVGRAGNAGEAETSRVSKLACTMATANKASRITSSINFVNTVLRQFYIIITKLEMDDELLIHKWTCLLPAALPAALPALTPIIPVAISKLLFF